MPKNPISRTVRYLAVLRCDGEADCKDGGDEDGCLEVPCAEWQFKCASSGICIHQGDFKELIVPISSLDVPPLEYAFIKVNC